VNRANEIQQWLAVIVEWVCISVLAVAVITLYKERALERLKAKFQQSGHPPSPTRRPDNYAGGSATGADVWDAGWEAASQEALLIYGGQIPVPQNNPYRASTSGGQQ
jgi:hypothetical protein